MKRALIPLLCCSALLHSAVVLDRIAAIVGKNVVKTSDIDRDLRLTAFLNKQPFSVTADDKKKSTERLIDQQIIRIELGVGNYARPKDADAQQLLDQITKTRFNGSTQRLDAALVNYGLTHAQLQAQLLWQLTVLRFIDQRFRPGILVTDEDVRAYFDQHHSELARENPANSTFDALEPKIRESLEGDRINQEFENWIKGARGRNRIEYRDTAFTTEVK